MLLQITNNLTKVTYDLTINDPQFSRLFLTGSIELPDNVVDGEYNYFVIDDNIILAQGLLQIGDYEQEDKISYDTPKSDDEFITYNG